MKKTEFRTKRKAQQEANTAEADQLIEEWVHKNYYYNQKTKKIIEEYLNNDNDDNERLPD